MSISPQIGFGLSPTALSRPQQQIVVISWLTYASFYLGRLNISPALAAIADELHISRAEVGILGTVFFWTYALGLFINGEVGNHLRPRRMILTGLTLIGLLNVLFAFQRSLWLMAVLWGLNGLAQSMGWGPIVRILSEHLSTEQRKRLSTIFSMSFQVGGGVTWAVSGLLVAIGGWRSAFGFPGVLLLIGAALWWLANIDAPSAAKVENSGVQWGEMQRELWTLLPILLATMFVGFVDVGALIWLPTFISDTALFPESLAGALSGILPLVGVGGMTIAGYLLQRLHRVFLTTHLLIGLTALSMLLAALTPTVTQVGFIVLTMFLISGIVALLLTTIPVMYAQTGRSSSAAGSLAAVFSLGGGLAGVIVGGLEEASGWSAVFGLWAVCLLVALGLSYVAQQRKIIEE